MLGAIANAVGRMSPAGSSAITLIECGVLDRDSCDRQLVESVGIGTFAGVVQR